MYHHQRNQPNYPHLDVNPPESEEEDDDEKRTIFCANLDLKVTEEILYEVFLQAGPIESVRIPKDHLGRQKTFGFITYVHKCTVPYALKLLAGLSLFRKCLTIKARDLQIPILPPDFEILPRKSGSNNRDNFALRGNNFNANRSGGDMNPFKNPQSPPQKQRIEWGSSQRRSDELQKHPTHNSRPHHKSPYSRSDSSRNHGGGSSGGGRQNRHGNDRRTEQRNRHR